MPSSTTSGMPPTRDPTTAVPQAMASRLTMPSGSYSDGQANTAAWVSSWITSCLGSISGIQITPDRVVRSPSTREVTSSSSSGVSATMPADTAITALADSIADRSQYEDRA